MEMYTKEFKEMLEDAEMALCFTVPKMLSYKAKVKAENKRDRLAACTKGNIMTQMFCAATVAGAIIGEMIENDDSEKAEEIAMATFLAAMKLEMKRQKEVKEK